MTRAEAIEIVVNRLIDWEEVRHERAIGIIDALLEAGMTFGEAEPRFVFVHRPQGESK